MQASVSGHLKYRPYVDGLRAVAVLPVILFHAGMGFSGGYVGVDVFFVISGYLITGLILKEMDTDRFHLMEFWERRIRRIMPALAVMVLASLVAAWFLFFPKDFEDFGKSMAAQAALVANFFFYSDAGYFAEGVDMKPLLHTWSLAVEEQFYLFFPFLLVALRGRSKKTLFRMLVILGGASFLLSVYCSYKHPRANFYLLPSRAWELLTGSFIAALPAQKTSSKWLNESLSLGGFAAILIAIFCYNSDTRFPGATALLPCVGAALIIWSSGHTLTLVGKLLALPPVVFIGLISYSLYLWHWPVLVFFKYWAVGAIPFYQRALLLILSVVLAALSWKFVEAPFRKRVVCQTQPQIYAFGVVTTAVLLFAGLAVFKLQGLPSRIPADALQYLAENTSIEGGTNSDFTRQLTLKEAQAGDFNEFGLRDKKLPVGLLVWGDSHAQVEMPVLDVVSREHSVRGLAATHSQTAPLIGYPSRGEWSLGKESVAFNDAVVAFIRSNHIGNVLIIARWDYYIEADQGTDRLRDGLLATLNALKDSGAKIWIMRQVPKYPWSVPKALASAVLHGRNPEQIGHTLEEQREQTQRQEPIFAGLSAKFPNVTVLDPTEYFADPSGRYKVAKAGKPLYWDSDHVNVEGSLMLRPLFEPIFGGPSKTIAPFDAKNAAH